MKKAPHRRRPPPSDQTDASISDLKKDVRKKIARGQALTKGGKASNLEAREIQIKIADLETKAAKAADVAKKKNSPITVQKVLRQTQALKRKLDS